MKHCLPCLLSFCLFLNISIAEENIEKRIYTTVRTENPPQIDGKLDDPIWSSAPKSSDFTQRKPNEGEKPTPIMLSQGFD